MTIQQFANEEFDEQKVNRHEVRQVLRGVRRISPEDWVEARRQRAAARTEQTAEWLRSGDPDLVTKALEYCRYDVQLTMDLAAILKRGEPLRLPPRAQRQELNEVLIWNDGRTERVPDASGAVSTR